MHIKNGLIFDLKQGFIAKDIYTKDSVITDISTGDEIEVDASDCYVIPGLIDLHFHGCCGEDFSDATPEGLQTIADYQLKNGITSICPAGMTLPEDQLIRICQNASFHHSNSANGADLVGINLEGPFLSAAKKGAQNEDYLRNPDLELLQKLQKEAGGLVKLITLAPEQPGSFDFIRNAKNVTISVGHTAADYNTALAAFSAGARQATHLYNGMMPLHHRNPAVIGAAFDSPETKVEIICDGIHIHPSVIRATFQLFGKERVILISDSIRAAGMPDGRYTLGGLDVILEEKRAVLADSPDTLAGSASNLMDCLKTAVIFGIPLADAVRAATYNPAQTLGIDVHTGSLEIGKDATMLLLNKKDLSIRNIIFHGKVIKS
ncbi:MAG: N-acetylglucosamine-6-phosphate deacetylase [Schaedlerella sp.]|nr:N-acetylglucosamine-6-phosphate deacetylase [Schaedlerella sp.]